MFQGREIDSSSVTSSALVTRELLDAERLRNLATLRKKLFLLPAEDGSGEREEVAMDDWWD